MPETGATIIWVAAIVLVAILFARGGGALAGIDTGRDQARSARSTTG